MDRLLAEAGMDLVGEGVHEDVLVGALLARVLSFDCAPGMGRLELFEDAVALYSKFIASTGED